MAGFKLASVIMNSLRVAYRSYYIKLHCRNVLDVLNHILGSNWNMVTRQLVKLGESPTGIWSDHSLAETAIMKL